jgi:hypothetical protein
MIDYIKTTEEIGKKWNETWFKRDEIRLSPEYQEYMKKVELEKWINLSYLKEVINKRRYDDAFPMDYRIALNWVLLVLEG